MSAAEFTAREVVEVIQRVARAELERTRAPFPRKSAAFIAARSVYELGLVTADAGTNDGGD